MAETSAHAPLAAVVRALGAAIDRRPGWAGEARARAAFAVLADESVELDRLTDPLADLATTFSLSPTDERLVAVALLAELHPSAHLLLGLLSGDDGPGSPTVALVLELTGLSTLDGEARVRLAALGPLRRHGILRLAGEDVFLARRLHVAERVVAHLLGDATPPLHLLPLLGRVTPVAVDGTAAVADALAAGENLVWIASPPGTAGLALAAAACQQLEVVCLLADLRRAPAAADVPGEAPGIAVHTARALVADLVLEAALGGSVLVLAGGDLAAGAVDLLAGSPAPVLAVGAGGWNPAWAADLPVAVAAPRLTTEQRSELWWLALGGHVPDGAITGLRLTPEQITVVGRHARRTADRAGTEITAATVKDSARRLGRGSGHSVASRRPGASAATLDDLVLPDRTRAEVDRLIGWAQHRDEVFALGDLQGKGGKGTGIAALFSGSPGTGKTLAAHVVADALGMDLFQIDLSTVVDKYIGETEKNLEKIFAEAESLNCVLFFDEADSLFGSRSSVTDSKDRYANQEVAYLLQRMESFDGITVLATNLRGNLDQAFARRLHFMIHFPDPDVPTRRSLWEHHLAQLPGIDPQDPVDLDVLATHLEVAGGDIRNIVLSATYESVAQGRLVGMRDLHFAVQREYTKLGRRVPANAFA